MWLWKPLRRSLAWLRPGRGLTQNIRSRITAPGYEPLVISGTEILADATAIQPARMIPAADLGGEEDITIPDHTLYGNYPLRRESEIKPVTGSGEIVLSRVVVPQTVIVHDGVPTNASAPDYYVPYRDYIKNVASSEIYATWPKSSITANVLAIMSFTLNRVYTEWYRNQGYDFTITSSTAYDHKWIYGRNIYESISVVVDDIFDNYLSRPEVKQPILTQYCDGRQVTCPGWMTFLLLRIHIKKLGFMRVCGDPAPGSVLLNNRNTMCMVSLWKTIRSTMLRRATFFWRAEKRSDRSMSGNGPDVIQHLPFLAAAVCVLFRPGRFQLL